MGKKGGGQSAVALPAYFGWEPDFQIYGSGLGGYSTSYNPAADKPSGTTKWVDNVNGSDSNAGTEGAPYKTLAKAITESAVVVNIKTGDYWRNDSLAASFASSTALALVAVDGPGTVRMGRIEDPGDLPSWTSEGSNTYSTTRSNVRTVLDLDETGHATKTLVDGTTAVPLPMAEVADLAAVQAHAGHAWAQVGSTLYVKTHDGRAPDTDVLPILIEENFEYIGQDTTLYMEGIEVWGDQPCFMDYNADNSARFVAVDCGFRYSGDFDNVYIDGCEDTRLVRCKTSHQLSSDDGFNYDLNSANPSYVHALEVDCEAHDNGDSTNDNGSTTHDPGTHIIRLNGDYGGHAGPGVVDSAGAHAVNFGVKSNDGYIGIQVGTFSGVNPAVQWNKDCEATGNSNTGRSRSTGGVQVELGGENYQNGKSDSNNYVDYNVHPQLETILTVAPDSIIGVYCVLDINMYCDIVSGEVDDFWDVSANKNNAAKIDATQRATYVSADNKFTIPDSSVVQEDVSYALAKSTDLYGVSMIGSYGDGTDTVFDFFDCLLTGSSSDQPRIMGSDGNNAMHSSGDFADGFARDGGSVDTSPLPMPLDFYDAPSDTGAVQTDTYHILGSNTYTDGRAWYSDDMRMIILRNRAWTTAEELAIRTAAKQLFGVS